MYYENLAKQYLQEALNLKKYLKNLKTQYVKLNNIKNLNDIKDEELSYRISILYNMYLDLVHTGKYLKRKCEVMKK